MDFNDISFRENFFLYSEEDYRNCEIFYHNYVFVKPVIKESLLSKDLFLSLIKDMDDPEIKQFLKQKDLDDIYLILKNAYEEEINK